MVSHQAGQVLCLKAVVLPLVQVLCLKAVVLPLVPVLCLKAVMLPLVLVIVSALLPAVAASDLLELELPVPCCLALMKAFMLVCFCSLGSKSGTVSIPKSFCTPFSILCLLLLQLVSVQSGRVSVLYHSHIKQMYSIV